MTDWNFGTSDNDMCCDDDQSPSYLIYMVTYQGHPSDWQGQGKVYYAIREYDMKLYDWLSSYDWPSNSSQKAQPKKGIQTKRNQPKRIQTTTKFSDVSKGNLQAEK